MIDVGNTLSSTNLSAVFCHIPKTIWCKNRLNRTTFGKCVVVVNRFHGKNLVHISTYYIRASEQTNKQKFVKVIQFFQYIYLQCALLKFLFKKHRWYPVSRKKNYKKIVKVIFFGVYFFPENQPIVPTYIWSPCQSFRSI